VCYRETTEGLGRMIARELQPPVLSDQLDLSEEESAFTGVASQCLSVLVLGINTHLDACLQVRADTSIRRAPLSSAQTLLKHMHSNGMQAVYACAWPGGSATSGYIKIGGPSGLLVMSMVAAATAGYAARSLGCH
jgi:hypothetical protein